MKQRVQNRYVAAPESEFPALAMEAYTQRRQINIQRAPWPGKRG